MIAFHVDKEKCIGCGLCAADCPMGIIAMEEGLPVIPAADEARSRGLLVSEGVIPRPATELFADYL